MKERFKLTIRENDKTVGTVRGFTELSDAVYAAAAISKNHGPAARVAVWLEGNGHRLAGILSVTGSCWNDRTDDLIEVCRRALVEERKLRKRDVECRAFARKLKAAGIDAYYFLETDEVARAAYFDHNLAAAEARIRVLSTPPVSRALDPRASVLHGEAGGVVPNAECGMRNEELKEQAA